jgi:tetratricopeptide (TPR) repeat protein
MLKCYSLPNYKIAQRLEKLADVYESIKNYDDAFINYDKALRIYLELIEENPNYVYNMISKILEIYTKHRNDYHSRRKYELLKHEYTLKINAPKSTDNDYITQEKIKTIANTYEQLGDFYQSISNYNEALDYYKRALMIHQQELESHYYPISSLTEKISNIYIEHKHDYQSALEYQLLCHEYTVKQTTPDTTTDDERIIDRKKYKRGVCHIELSDFYVRIHQYDLAKKHLLIALNLYQEVQTMTLEHKIEIVNEKLKNVEKFLT